jgi:hypothetical protein
MDDPVSVTNIAQTAFNFALVIFIVWLPFWLIRKIRSRPSTQPAEEAPNTWKFRTVVFLILAVVFPLWPITLPLFLYIAYRSYKSGSTQYTISTSANSAIPVPDKTSQLGALHDLLTKGALTQLEYEQEKKRILDS